MYIYLLDYFDTLHEFYIQTLNEFMSDSELYNVVRLIEEKEEIVSFEWFVQKNKLNF